MQEKNDKNHDAKKAKVLSDQKKAYRELLEERAANNGTMIIHKNGRSILVYARKLLDELIAGENKQQKGKAN